jgi:hypothetical protein
MFKIRERLLTLAVVACVLPLCAGPAFAAFTVDIVRPSIDPLETKEDYPVCFEAVGLDEGQQDVSGQVDWQWDFGDTHGSTENPVSHAFDNAGNYTVWVTGTYNGQEAQDSTGVVVQEQGEEEAGWHLRITPESDGMVCDDRRVWVLYDGENVQEVYDAIDEIWFAYRNPPRSNDWNWNLGFPASINYDGQGNPISIEAESSIEWYTYDLPYWGNETCQWKAKVVWNDETETEIGPRAWEVYDTVLAHT